METDIAPCTLTSVELRNTQGQDSNLSRLLIEGPAPAVMDEDFLVSIPLDKLQSRASFPGLSKVCVPTSIWPLHPFRRKQRQFYHIRKSPSRTCLRTFIVLSHWLEASSDIGQTVCNELCHDCHLPCNIDTVHPTPKPCLQLTCKDEWNLLPVLEIARDKANEFINGDTSAAPLATRTLVVEAPSFSTSTFEVVIDRDSGLPSVRRQELVNKAVAPMCNLRGRVKFVADLPYAVMHFLEGVGHPSRALMLRVDFGRFKLLAYPSPSTMKFDQFVAMLETPRVCGELDRWDTDKVKLLRMLAALRTDIGTFQPLENRGSSTLPGLPKYSLEVVLGNSRFEAAINPIYKGESLSDKVVMFGLKNLEGFDESRSTQSDLHLTVIRINKALDWEITAFARERPVKPPADFERLLQSAHIWLQAGDQEDVDCYPRLKLPSGQAQDWPVDRVVLKTAYQFGCNGTSYVLDMVVRREWSQFAALSNGENARSTKISASVTNDWWDSTLQENSDNVIVGSGSDSNLNRLFGLEHDTSHTGLERAQALITHIQRVATALEISAERN